MTSVKLVLLTCFAIAEMLFVPHMYCWRAWAKGKWSKTLFIRNCKQAGAEQLGHGLLGAGAEHS